MKMEMNINEYSDFICFALYGIDREIKSNEDYIMRMQEFGDNKEAIKKSEEKIKELRENRERIKLLLTIDELKIV